MQKDLQQQWQQICERIRNESRDAVLQGWLSQLSPEMTDAENVVISAPTRFMRDWLVDKAYDALMTSMWQQINPAIKAVQFAVLPAPEIPEEEPVAEIITDNADSNLSHLNPAFTFENFVVGKPNEFATAAARRVATIADIAFNPLYIHSSVGLGKTHLMHAIAWELRKSRPGCRFLYLSAEQFMYQFVKALKTQDTLSFRDMFREVDVLMVDDIQFICGKKATQEEFFHTFNELISEGKQIVLCSDSSPLALKDIDARLKTRLAQGLVVDIFPTTYEMRIGILQSKAQAMNAAIPQDVIEFLAERITTNVRELEGALRRVVANAQLLGSPITLDTTKMILRDTLNLYEKELSIDLIQKETAEYFQIQPNNLKSNSKERRVAQPRQIAMYLSKVLTTHSLPEIGAAFDRDHTTIMHAVRTIEERMKADLKVYEDVEALRKSLQRYS